jgi:hypothetical protein
MTCKVDVGRAIVFRGLPPEMTDDKKAIVCPTNANEDGWWAIAGSNRGPPACKAGALTN